MLARMQSNQNNMQEANNPASPHHSPMQGRSNKSPPVRHDSVQKLSTQASSIQALQGSRATGRQARAAQAQAQQVQRMVAATTAEAPPPPPMARHNSVAATPDSIRKERDRLLKEKAQWVQHAQTQNAILVKLLHDARAGKALLQAEVSWEEEEGEEEEHHHRRLTHGAHRWTP
jgi:hypothetical protein